MYDFNSSFILSSHACPGVCVDVMECVYSALVGLHRWYENIQTLTFEVVFVMEDLNTIVVIVHN